MMPEDWVWGLDKKMRWRDDVTSEDDEDLKEGEIYAGKTAKGTTKEGYTIQFNDKDNLPASGRLWEYVLPELNAGNDAPSLADEIRKLMPVLNTAEAISTVSAMAASGSVGAAESAGNFLINGIGRRATFISGLRLAEMRALGTAGELAVGISGGKQIIEVGGRFRIPDRITTGFLEEVKNVKYQSLTSQLKDFYQYSQEQGLRMILHTRSTTILSKPLQTLVDQGKIIQQFIPGL